MRYLYKNLNDDIDIVVKEGGNTNRLTMNGNQFAYIDKKYDITKLVIAKLGLKEPEVKE